MNKPVIRLVALVSLGLVLTKATFAAYQWEVNPPAAPGGALPGETIDSLVKYLYYWLLGLGGFSAFIRLSMAGILWAGAGGNITKTSQAMDIIRNVIFGLALLLFSWLILNTVNPRLVNPELGANSRPETLAQTEDLGGLSLDQLFKTLSIQEVEPDIFKNISFNSYGTVPLPRPTKSVGESPQPAGQCSTGGTVPDLPSASGACRTQAGALGLPPSFLQAVSAAAETFNVPPSLILGVMYGEGAFNESWTEEGARQAMQEGACLPDCDPNEWPATGVIPWFESGWNEVADAINAIAPGRTPSVCNLLDNIFAVAKFLDRYQVGYAQAQGKTCFGINLNYPLSGGSAFSPKSGSCDWAEVNAETAIKFWENGTWDVCFTKQGSCLLGGGPNASCTNGMDGCETKTNRYATPGEPNYDSLVSHNACIWDVYQKNK